MKYLHAFICELQSAYNNKTFIPGYIHYGYFLAVIVIYIFFKLDSKVNWFLDLCPLTIRVSACYEDQNVFGTSGSTSLVP